MNGASMRLGDVCAHVPVEVVRDGEFQSVGMLSDATPAMLGCLSDARYLKRETCQHPTLSCLVTHPALVCHLPPHLGVAVAEDVPLAFYSIHRYLSEHTGFYWRDFPTEVSPQAEVHPTAWIAPRNVRIGRGTVIGPNVVVNQRSIIGQDVTVGSGTVIGAEGFDPKELDGRLENIPHAGGVVIHDCVTIQSNCVVCRARFSGLTEIGAETVIGNLTHVSHEVRVGRRCRIAAACNISGGTRIGDNVRIGPHTTVSNRLTVGDDAVVSIGSVVVRDVAPGTRVTGNFAVEHDAFLAWYRRLLKRA